MTVGVLLIHLRLCERRCHGRGGLHGMSRWRTFICLCCKGNPGSSVVMLDAIVSQGSQRMDAQVPCSKCARDPFPD